jgi:hypothetical protein
VARSDLVRTRIVFDKSRLNRNDAGGVSLQGIIVLIVVIGIVWGALSLFPVFNLPMDLENTVKKAADGWLRLSPREQTQQLRRQAVDEIRSIVVDKLANHTWDKKELEVSVTNNHVDVHLPYTLNINLFGFELTFDKELNVSQEALSF